MCNIHANLILNGGQPNKEVAKTMRERGNNFISFSVIAGTEKIPYEKTGDDGEDKVVFSPTSEEAKGNGWPSVTISTKTVAFKPNGK